MLGYSVRTYDLATRSCHVFTTNADFGFWKSILVPIGCYPIQSHESARKSWPVTSLHLSSRNIFLQKPTLILVSMGSKSSRILLTRSPCKIWAGVRVLSTRIMPAGTNLMQQPLQFQACDSRRVWLFQKEPRLTGEGCRTFNVQHLCHLLLLFLCGTVWVVPCRCFISWRAWGCQP